MADHEPILDHAGAEVLSPDECVELLRAATVGRVAFVHDGDVVILPVNLGVWHRSVVFRTQSGSKLDAAIMAEHVSVEVDGVDEAARQGWSVLVRGTAVTVDDEETTDQLDQLGVEPWIRPDAPRTWVRVVPDEITGRRVPRG